FQDTLSHSTNGDKKERNAWGMEVNKSFGFSLKDIAYIQHEETNAANLSSTLRGKYHRNSTIRPLPLNHPRAAGPHSNSWELSRDMNGNWGDGKMSRRGGMTTTRKEKEKGMRSVETRPGIPSANVWDKDGVFVPPGKRKAGGKDAIILNGNIQGLPKLKESHPCNDSMEKQSSRRRVKRASNPVDNPNGFNFLEPRDLSLMEIQIEEDHPWKDYYEKEKEEVWRSFDSSPAPLEYNEDSLAIWKPSFIRDVTRGDVIEFRAATAEEWMEAVGRKEEQLPDSVASRRKLKKPVIYQYTAAINKSMGILEAVHFELFLPNRRDLRFIVIPYSDLPSETIEGDYFFIHEFELMSGDRWSIELGGNYDVVWSVRRLERIASRWREREGLAYIVQSDKRTDSDTCVSTLVDHEFLVNGALYEDAADRVPNTLAAITMSVTSGAHLYPVERPRREEYDRWNEAKRRGEEDIPMPEEKSWYMKELEGVMTSSQRDGRMIPTGMEKLSEKDGTRLIDRLDHFKMYNRDSVDYMHNLFTIGARFRVNWKQWEEKEEDDESVTVDDSVILKTLADKAIMMGECDWMLDLIYGKKQEKKEVERNNPTWLPMTVGRKDGTTLTLNTQQDKALRLYLNERRALCILSPPGSGKTTVAAVMAACSNGVQLLLAVQNVAVDNMAAALKELAWAKEVYNVKGVHNLDPEKKHPYDLFDKMDEDKLNEWKRRKKEVDGKDDWKARLQWEYALTNSKSEYERQGNPTIVLSTVEMVLFKMFNTNSNFNYWILNQVKRVIIDEASLLTEAALYCLFRRFPQAQFAFIGDDKQLPPFMFDPKILGHQLAGRSALSVVMKNGNIPVIQLDEVYRAPPTLVAPYNRLSYGGKLVSRKAEGEGLLSSLGLIPPSRPQLLFVDVDGAQLRNKLNKSLFNEREEQVLLSLLIMFPDEWKKRIMIICLYKEQKRRLEAVFGSEYTILTVDSSQGKEKPIVILLTSRTEQKQDMGFFCCQKRCTVAISRHQEALIIFGCSSILAKNRPWSTVVNGEDFTRIRDRPNVKKNAKEE
ncbi:hypothetical protein PMAYCL1PPCAC_12781, partial [Pristionchus mayeri]